MTSCSLNFVVIRPIEKLVDFLQQQKNTGVQHLALDEAARDSMRKLFLFYKKQKKSAAEGNVNELLGKIDAPLNASTSGSEKNQRLGHLREMAQHWAPALKLPLLGKKLVFSMGNPDAKLMFITDAVGYHEEKSGKPIAGESSGKFEAILKAMGLSMNDVYITSVVKFRPQAPRQVTNTRLATAEEFGACLPLLKEEIAIVQPDCVVLLGSTTAKILLELDESTVGAGRNQWHHFEGVPTRATYHPSMLLSSQGLTKKRELWEDMLAVMQQLGISISEKQQAYFK